MKKIGVLLVLVLLIFSVITFVLAENETDSNLTESSDSSDASSTSESTSESYSSTSVESSSEDVKTLGNLTKGFECLESKAGEGCKDVDSVDELSFIVLSTPDNIMDSCVEKLVSKMSNNNFGSIKDTALALLALNHAGKDTEAIEKWLLEQRQNPSDITWFLQQDSENATGCKIDDGSLNYEIQIDENKKINKDAGKCLKRAMSNFWYKIDPSCYAKLFKISCDQEFITNLLYKNDRSSTIYVLENTQTSEAYGYTEHLVNSKCLGKKGTCDYEGTAWGAYALSVTDNDIGEFIPYLISSGDLKGMYLPNAFIYLTTGYENFGTQLIQEQKFGSYWEAEATVYNRYYDTALALLALGTTQDQTQVAKNWLLYEQGVNGCWNNNVRETAFILWVLLKRDYYVPETGSTTVYCDEADFYCVDKTLCSEENDVGDNYYCSGYSKTCCKVLELDSCMEMGGGVCPEGEVCRGLETQASDTSACCLAGCKVADEVTTECEEDSYSNGCYSSCGEDMEPVSLDCTEGMVCCKKVEQEAEGGGIPWWLWLLLVLIILVIAAILYVYRDKLKRKKGGDDDSSSRPGMPPRPGMPLRPMRSGMPPRRPGMRPGMPPRRPGMPPRPGMRPSKP